MNNTPNNHIINNIITEKIFKNLRTLLQQSITYYQHRQTNNWQAFNRFNFQAMVAIKQSSSNVILIHTDKSKPKHFIYSFCINWEASICELKKN